MWNSTKKKSFFRSCIVLLIEIRRSFTRVCSKRTRTYIMASFRAAVCALFAQIFALVVRCAPTATRKRNQSVHANPTTSYPNRSDAAHKQEKPASSNIPITPSPKSSANTPVCIALIVSLSAHTTIMSKNPDLPPPLLIPLADHD